MDVRERSAPRPDTAAPISAGLAARYSPLFEIGRGGMGTIEVALEARSERVVALKRMHPLASRERRQTEMFLREARLAAALVHPNVVHAFDFGESEGELFLAMEYVEGETLSALVRTAREHRSAGLPPALVASILADTCEGLHAAHELRDPQTGAPLNVIHRDVSPHNVMVSYEGHVKLLDFGVAKIDSLDPLTRTGEIKGKTAYMSPEQGMGEPLDRRSDLFTMGAVLFECVTGERMYGSGTEIEVLRRLALEDPPSLADAAPHAPQALVDLHARLVSRAPADRPATALAVAQELRAFVAASGVRVDAAVIAEAMASLFANGAAERKRLLNEALASRVPPARVAVVRRSLAGPTALAALAQTMPQGRFDSSAPAPPLPPSLPPMGEPPPPVATKSGVIVSAIVGLVLASGVVAFTTRGQPRPATLTTVAPTATSTATSTSISSATSIATSTPTSASTPTSTSAPTSASASTSTSTSTPTSIATQTPPPPLPHRRPKPAASAPPHVDVDTNPL